MNPAMYAQNLDLAIGMDLDQLAPEEYDSIARQEARVLSQRLCYNGRNVFGDHMSVVTVFDDGSRAAGPVRVYSVAIPMGWIKFMGMSEQTRANYLIKLQNDYHANAQMIATMFGVDESAVNLEMDALRESGYDVGPNDEIPRTFEWRDWLHESNYSNPAELHISAHIISTNRHTIIEEPKSMEYVPMVDECLEENEHAFDELLMSMGIYAKETAK